MSDSPRNSLPDETVLDAAFRVGDSARVSEEVSTGPANVSPESPPQEAESEDDIRDVIARLEARKEQLTRRLTAIRVKASKLEDEERRLDVAMSALSGRDLPVAHRTKDRPKAKKSESRDKPSPTKETVLRAVRGVLGASSPLDLDSLKAGVAEWHAGYKGTGLTLRLGHIIKQGHVVETPDGKYVLNGDSRE